MIPDALDSERQDVGSAIDDYSAKRFQAAVKRGLDRLGAGFLLFVLSPLFCLVALLVRLQDGGPILHKRWVVGPKGELAAYKFRTMRIDADQVLAGDPELRRRYERNFKLAHDPRVTRVGGFLRKYSLDELPQLWNVVQGEMSLVGPRMITKAELEKYGPYQEIIVKIKPGITGYWQVNGRQRLSYGERVQMDMNYIRHWSLLLDLYILCRTPLKVIRGEGAY